MNKRQIIETLNNYNFDQKEYVIIASAALVLRGIKDKAEDIDITVSPKLKEYLLENYNCQLKSHDKDIEVYNIDNIIDFSTYNYDKINYDLLESFKIQNLNGIIDFKKKLNRSKDREDLKLINKYLNIFNINSLALAYLGDAVYELYIRKYLIGKNINKVNVLQKEAINYVSAKSQSNFLERMLKDNFFTEEEINIIKRARNHKSHGSPKSTDIITYKRSTGLEALIGYLDLKNDKERIEEIMNYIVGD